METAQQVAGGLSKGGLYFVVGVCCVVILGLFSWLMRVNALRIRDRDTFQEKLEAIAQRVMDHVLKSSESNLLLTRAIDDLRLTRRRAQSEPREPPK